MDLDLFRKVSVHLKKCIEDLEADRDFKNAMLQDSHFTKFAEYISNQWIIYVQRKHKNLELIEEGKFEWFVRESLNLLESGLKSRVKREYESDLSRRTREATLNKQKDLEATMTSGKLIGEYSDLEGVHLVTEENSKEKIIEKIQREEESKIIN